MHAEANCVKPGGSGKVTSHGRKTFPNREVSRGDKSGSKGGTGLNLERYINSAFTAGVECVLRT